MTKEDNSNKNRVRLKTLTDVQDLIDEVLTEIKCREGLDESSGKINQLLQTWIKCFMARFETEEVLDIKRRVFAIETELGMKKK